MKQYVVFSELHPTGIVVDAKDLSQFETEDGYVYEIGQKIGSIEEVLKNREEE